MLHPLSPASDFTRSTPRINSVIRAGYAAVLLTVMLMGATPATPARAGTPAAPLVLAPAAPEVSPSTCNAEINGDNVTDFASTDAQALRDAVAAVPAGGTVKVAGTCAGAVSQGGDSQVVLITKNLTLIGGYTTSNWLAASNPTANATALIANATGRVISATQPIIVANLTVQAGFSTGPGGGLFTPSSVVLSNATFIQNSSGAGEGGGVYAGGAVTLNGGSFISNTAFSNGGGLYADVLTLSGTQFESNTGSSGGGAFVLGPATLNGGLFQNNTATFREGGGLNADTLTMTGTQFIGNRATGANSTGGGVYADGAATLNGGSFISNTSVSKVGGGAYFSSTATLNGTTFTGNTARQGGGVYAAGAATLTGTTFNGNDASYDGGGVYAAGAVALHNTQFSQNSAFVGAGVFAAGAATLKGGLFQNNYSFGSSSWGGGSGGGGMVALSTLALTGTQFTGNKATINGGGLTVYGAATLNGGRFENNISERIGGGGVYALSTITLSGTAFISNTADTNGGGGVYLAQSEGVSRIVNSLFARNSAGGSGDAMFLLDAFGNGGTVDIIHTTIASPTLSAGNAIVVGKGTVNLTNTLISNHTAGISQTGTAVVNENFTLFSGVTTPRLGTVNAGANSFAGTAGFVDPAAGNYRLTLASSAVNAGTNAGITQDFDGNSRPNGVRPDIGAFEFNNMQPTANAGPAQSVLVNVTVTLDGLGSFDPEDQALTYAWTQLSGPAVTLSSNTAAESAFTAPAVTSAATLVFQLVVTDAGGVSSAPAQVEITVMPAQVMIPLVAR